MGKTSCASTIFIRRILIFGKRKMVKQIVEISLLSKYEIVKFFTLSLTHSCNTKCVDNAKNKLRSVLDIKRINKN